jgi:GH18 family chitinase
MLNRNLSYVLLVGLTVLAACSKKSPNDGPDKPVIAPPPDFGFKIVGYVPNYRDPAAIPDVKFRMTNVINYAFATINASGVPVVNNPTRLPLVVTKAKANNAKVLISLNGSTANWKTMATTASGRNLYIQAVMNIIRQYELDGADVDWEFPSTADGTDTMYTALIKELSDSCHLNRKYYLSAALTAGKFSGSYRDAIKAEVFDYFDWMNIMAYDDFSSSVPYRQHSPYALADTCLKYWLGRRGMPKAKCVLGVPAYGRPSGITQTNTVLTYGTIIQQYGPAYALTDSAVVTSSGYPSPYTVYYNGQPTIRKKTALAKLVANGVMMWEKGQDSHDSTSLLKAVNDELGRSY